MENSPFNKLAAEVRNLIYHFTLVQDDDILLDAEPHDEWSYMAQLHPDSGAKRMLALTCTCEQMRNESLPVVLGSNHFKVTPAIPWDADGDCFLVKPHTSMILCWMARLGSWAPCLRSLQIEVSDSAVQFGWEAKLAWLLEELRFVLDRPKLRLAITVTTDWKRQGTHYALTVSFNGHDHLVGPTLDRDSANLKERVEQEVSYEALRSSIFANIDEMQRVVAKALEFISGSS